MFNKNKAVENWSNTIKQTRGGDTRALDDITKHWFSQVCFIAYIFLEHQKFRL